MMISFFSLRGLPKIFNNCKTTVRGLQQGGHSLTFNEVVTMLHGEDIQLLQESSTEIETGSVLVATHGQGKMPTGSMASLSSSTLNVPQLPSSTALSYNGLTQSFGQLGLFPQQFGPSQQYGSQLTSGFPSPYGYYQSQPLQCIGPTGQQSLPPQSSQQFFQPSFRNLNRGRWRGPHMPCEICGKSNHSTKYCHYRPQSPYFPNLQWRPLAQAAPWMSYSTPLIHGYPSGMPMYQPQIPQSQSPMVQQFGPSQTSSAPIPSPQTPFAGFTEVFSVPSMDYYSGCYTGTHQSFAPSPAGVRGAQFNVSNSMLPSVASSSSVSAQPWYFDSGATHHITNNLQNLANPQPTSGTDGIMVGNGSHLQVSHIGEGLLPTPSKQFQLPHVLHTPLTISSQFISLLEIIIVL